LNLLVDTSVWSLALRRDSPAPDREVAVLRRALQTGELVLTTGVVLQELLQGFTGPKAGDEIVLRFAALPFLVPERDDHIRAAEIHNTCRRRGITVGTIDALLAALCIRHDLTMLSADSDFGRIADVHPLAVWRP
jgi:predicted nucleic acid-binding protein